MLIISIKISLVFLSVALGNNMLMKYKSLIACFAALFFIQSLFAQHDRKTKACTGFCLEYNLYGIGFGDVGMRRPKFILHDSVFIYSTIRRNGLAGVITIDTTITGIISVRDFKRIISAVKNYKDTVFSSINACFIGGSHRELNIISNEKSVEFDMYNTFQPTAVKVIRIMNKYLPKQEQIHVERGYRKAEKDCMEFLGFHKYKRTAAVHN